MCLIIHKREDQSLSDSELRAVWKKNNDGWGILFVASGEVHALRGLKLQELQTAVKQHSARELFIHFRMATHGPKNLDNTHPFEILPGLWLMHNGIISIAQTANKELSDTWHYTNLVLRPLLESVPANVRSEFIRSGAFRFIVETSVGKSNRILLLDAAGPVILNRSEWHTIKEKDLLVSNTYAFDEREFLGKPQPEKKAKTKDAGKIAATFGAFARTAWDCDDADDAAPLYGYADYDELEFPPTSNGRHRATGDIDATDTWDAMDAVIRAENLLYEVPEESALEYLQQHPESALQIFRDAYESLSAAYYQ